MLVCSYLIEDKEGAGAPLARREMTEELKRLLSCLGKLDPEKQRIVLLAYYSGRPVARHGKIRPRFARRSSVAGLTLIASAASTRLSASLAVSNRIR